VFNNQIAHWVDLAQLIICVFLKFGLVEVELASSKSVGNDAWLQQLGRTVWLVFHAGSSTMKSCRFSNKTDYHDQAKNIFQFLVHVSPLFFFVSGI